MHLKSLALVLWAAILCPVYAQSAPSQDSQTSATATTSQLYTSEHPRVLLDYADSQTVLVGWIDLAKLDLEKIWATLATASGSPVPDEQLSRFDSIRNALLELDVSRVYCLSELVPVPQGQLLLIPCDKPQAVELFLGAIGARGWKFEAMDQVVLGAPQSSLAALKSKRGEAIPQLWEAVAACKQDHGLAFAIPDYVATALMAALRSEDEEDRLDELLQAAQALASLKWLSASLGIMPQEILQVHMETDSEADAEQLQDLLNRLISSRLDEAPNSARFEQSEASVRYNSRSLQRTAGLIRSLLMARGSTRSANNLKQVALALHNHYSAYKRLPPQSLVDPEGERLLSWRVLILPFMDHMDLYNKFHLDEPWDSPHNLELAKEIPDIFAATDLEGKPLQKQGFMLTRIVAPLTENTVFGRPGRPVHFRDITDGTSNTLWIVETTDKQAVVWTMPEDLVVDTARPMVSIAGEDAQGFLGSLADGSVRFFSAENKDEVINALLTISGREVIEDLK